MYLFSLGVWTEGGALSLSDYVRFLTGVFLHTEFYLASRVGRSVALGVYALEINSTTTAKTDRIARRLDRDGTKIYARTSENTQGSAGLDLY